MHASTRDPVRPHAELSRVLRSMVAFVFLAAAILKAWNAHEFSAVLRHVLPDELGHRSWLTAIGAVVVAWESILGMLLLRRETTRFAILAAVITLVFFVVVLMTLAIDPNAPSCGCLGIVAANRHAEAARTDAIIGLVRNASMLWILIWLHTTSRPKSEPVTQSTRSPASSRRGFTMVELLVIIAVITILAALLQPALSSAQIRAMEVTRESICRQLLIATSSYAHDSFGGYPYLGNPGNPDEPIRIDGWTAQPPYSYFQMQSRHWLTLLVPTYYESRDAAIDSFYDVGSYPAEPDAPQRVIHTPFRFTHTAFAASRYWSNPQPPPIDFSVFRGMRESDVTSPASKGLLLDVASARERQDEGMTANVGVADGSVRDIKWNDATLTGDRVVERHTYGATAWPVLSTTNGLAGRDF